MFLRLVFESFRRQKRRKSIALLAIALGMSIATAMIAIGTDVGDKINQELRTYSANLLLTPVEDTLDVNLGGVSLRPATEGAFISEASLVLMKKGFWSHNILGYAPFLPAPETFSWHGNSLSTTLIGTYFAQTVHYGNESFNTGVRSVNSWWKVEGEWPPDYADWPSDDSPAVLAGSKLARLHHLAIGDELEVRGRKLRISGILTTSGVEDQSIVAPLHIVQQLIGRPDAVRSATVSALTKPEDAFARRNPATMSPAMRERWSCTPYANSIAFQIHENLPNVRVEQIRQVEQNQGRILSRISGLMLLLTFAALVAAALAISAAMAATILERRQEVGLMKSLGAGNGAVASLFLTEAGLLAVIGGGIGFMVGALLARQIGRSIFGSAITVHPVVLMVVIFSALLVTFAGSAGAIRKAMRFDPAIVLRGNA